MDESRNVPAGQLVQVVARASEHVAQLEWQKLHWLLLLFLYVPAGHVATQVLDVVNANGGVQEVQLDEEAAVHVAHEVSQL